MISSDCIEVYPDRAAWLAARRSVLVPSTVNAGRAKLGYPPVPEPDGSRQVSWPVEHRIGASDIGRDVITLWRRTRKALFCAIFYYILMR
jgi:hypothetical protein